MAERGSARHSPLVGRASRMGLEPPSDFKKRDLIFAFISVLHSSALCGLDDRRNPICTSIIGHIFESGQIASGIRLGGARFAQHSADFIVSTTKFDSRAEACRFAESVAEISGTALRGVRTHAETNGRARLRPSRISQAIGGSDGASPSRTTGSGFCTLP